MAAIATVRSPGPAYALLFLRGVSGIVGSVLLATLLQRSVPAGRLARVDGLVASLTLAVGIAGSAAGPVLVEAGTLPVALVVVSATSLAAGVAAAVGTRPSGVAEESLTD